MARFREFGALIITVLAAVMIEAQFTFASCPTGFANFGDSLTDTGNAEDAFPFYSDAENPPYGEFFFGKPAKRFCNGRLVPDFFSQAFRVQLLEPYFSVTTFNYVNGINLAHAGANAALAATQINPFALTPFQTSQFLRFQNSLNNAKTQPGCGLFTVNLPGQFLPAPFATWLYTIEAGGNDILPPLEGGVPLSVVNNTIVPQAVAAVAAAITALYQDSGARQFLIFGLPAGGCSTVVLTAFASQTNLTKDSLGCLISVNSIVQNFNTQLKQQIALLRAKFTDATIAYFDYYAANIEILTNPTTYGFAPTLTLTACCGAPGVYTLNYNPAVTCGRPGSNNCANPDKYVIWDGVHFTENFYRQIATFALTGKYTDGGPNYSSTCFLDFSQFGRNVTYNTAFPQLGLSGLYTQCNNFFT